MRSTIERSQMQLKLCFLRSFIRLNYSLVPTIKTEKKIDRLSADGGP